MNESIKYGPGAAPSSVAEPVPTKEGEDETPVRCALEPKPAWPRPTVRVIHIDRTTSGAGGTNIAESGPYGVTWGDPS